VSKEKTIDEVFRRVEDTLLTAQLGLEHLTGEGPSARLAGLRNVAVFGRTVTNVLQNLRSICPNFDDWYQPYVKEMRSNDLMRFFYKLRTEILKEGAVKVHRSVTLDGDLMALMRHFKPPPRTKGFFVADRNGGTGWEVDIEDSKTEKFYVQLPKEIPGLRIDVNIHLSQAPDEFQQVPAAELCKNYLAYLSCMVADAKKAFL
jgi:hypothetical protein